MKLNPFSEQRKHLALYKLYFLAVFLFGLYNVTSAYNNTYAIIVGVADYRDFGPWDGDLVYSVPDAVGFRSFLMSKKGGSVPSSNILFLTDAQASKSNIISMGKALFAKAKKNDRVIFFFAGHGSKGCFM